jgi:hypothetical protein
MTLETIGIVLTVVAMLAASVERGVELFRPLLMKINNLDVQNAAKIGVAVVLGILVAALLRLDILATVGISYSPWAGYVAAGVLASAGASPWHALLEWLKTLQTK